MRCAIHTRSARRGNADPFHALIENEAVLKVLFKHKEGDLTFVKALAVGVETEEAAKVAKDSPWCDEF